MKNPQIIAKEETLQDIFISDLKRNNWEQLEYSEVIKNDNIRNQKDVILKKIFISSLQRINKEKKLPNDLFETFYQQIVQEMNNYHFDTSINLNEIFIKYLRQGRRINEAIGKKNERPLIRLIDHKNVSNNVFHFICEFKNGDKNKNRADIVLFVNGLPVIVIELKSIIKGVRNIKYAWQQLKNYHHDYHQLFAFNLFSVVCNEVEQFYGSIFSKENEDFNWKQWKKSRLDQKYLQFPDLDSLENIEEQNINLRRETFIDGILNHKTVHDFILHFIFFKKTPSQKTKIIAFYHQYYSVLSAFENIKKNKKKVGIIHHTQGSGKTITMIFLSHLIQQLTNYIVFLITDRVKLDNQLFERFQATENYFSLPVEKIEKENKLSDTLIKTKNQMHGIFISTLQKFNQKIHCLSKREDILIIADEAHRSQYNFTEFNEQNQNFKENFGFARFLRIAFPNASFLGFTATPIDVKERTTIKVFGEVLQNDIYDMRQSINDKTTVPLTYRYFPILLKENKEIKEKLIFEKNVHKTSEYFKEIKKDYLFQDLDRIEKVFSKFKEQYLNLIKNNKLFGKALFVSKNRWIAWLYFKRMNRDPFFKNKVTLIISKSHKDGCKDQEMRQHLKGINIKEQINKFENFDSEIKVAIVCDMLLTGFDMPHLDQIYFDKELETHNLYQAIGRVNRVFNNKKHGVIISFFDLEKKINDAISSFSNNDQEKNKSNNSCFTNENDLITNVDQIINQLHQFISCQEIKTFFNNQKYLNFLNETKNWKNFSWEYQFDLLNKPLKQQFIQDVLEKLIINLNAKKSINNNEINDSKNKFAVLCERLKKDYIYIFFNNSQRHMSLKIKGLFFWNLFIFWKKLVIERRFDQNNWQDSLTKKDKEKISLWMEEKVILESKNLFPTNEVVFDQKKLHQISDTYSTSGPNTQFIEIKNQLHSIFKKAKKILPISYQNFVEKLRIILDKYNNSLYSKNQDQNTKNALNEITTLRNDAYQLVNESKKSDQERAYEDILKTDCSEFSNNKELLQKNIFIIIKLRQDFDQRYSYSLWSERRDVASEFIVKMITKMKETSSKLNDKKIKERSKIILEYIKDN